MLIILIVLALNSFCSSAPIDPTQPETVHWKSPPGTRGTLELVSSCVITLGLCTWSSLHLNIPAHNESMIRQTVRKIGWALFTLVTPEFVVFIAWYERIEAMKLSEKVTEILGSEKLDAKPWTVVHGFYAKMGGFILEIDPKIDPFIPPTNPPTDPIRLTLTLHGVELLIESGYLRHFPPLSEEFIADKGKANGLTKMLVCVQALWSVIQIVGRFASRLPITLLEINTMGHVICALVIYFCWWSKPQGVLVSTLLPEEACPRPMCAYMWMMSSISGGARASRDVDEDTEMNGLYMRVEGSSAAASRQSRVKRLYLWVRSSIRAWAEGERKPEMESLQFQPSNATNGNSDDLASPRLTEPRPNVTHLVRARLCLTQYFRSKAEGRLNYLGEIFEGGSWRQRRLSRTSSNSVVPGSGSSGVLKTSLRTG